MIQKNNLTREKSIPLKKSTIELKQIPTNKILANFYQPRERFERESIKELAESIKKTGLINPITVRKWRGDRFMIVTGERRWRATKLANLTTMSTFVKEYTNETQFMIESLIENVQREDLTSMEKAKSIEKIWIAMGKPVSKHNPSDPDKKRLYQVLSLSESSIGEHFYLIDVKTPKEVKQAVEKGKLAMRSATLIKKLPDEEQIVIAKEAMKRETGIDMSPSKFIVRNDNINMSMPEEINISLKNLKKSHRNLSRKKKGSKNRLKARKLLQKKYWKLNNQKNNFYHQTSYKLIRECKIIGIEDLNIKGMMMGNYNATNFQKSGWATFINKYLIYKAESAGCQVWACDRFEPTSKKCSGCGHIKKELKLSDRIYNCSECGLSIDRDLNASINIKKTCRLGINLCGADSSTLVKEQESVLKQEGHQLIGD